MSDNHAGVELSALAAALPVVFYLIVIWWFDRYEREPWWLVLLTFIYGAIGAILLGVILSLTVITMLANVAAAPGVPVSAPVAVLNCAQVGLFWIENASVSPSSSLACGVIE